MSGPELAQYRSEGEGQGRAYRHPKSGVLVPSVTTVLKMAAKDGLPQWASNLAIKWAYDNIHLAQERDASDFMGAGKYQWTKVRDERAFLGTEIHEYIEADLRDSWDMPQPWDPEILEMVDQWRKFRAQHEIIPHHIETTVWSHEHGYAGTFDWLGELDGVLCIADNKSSRSLWPDHEMQLAALARADVLMVKQADGTWVEVPMPKVDGYAFIHIRPTYRDPLMRIDEPPFCRVEYLDPADVDDRFDQFIGYLQTWKADRSIRERRKVSK